MKKIAMLLFVGLMMASCGQYKSTKGTRVANKTIKGEWTLSSVTYNQTGKYDITLLNDTSAECFEGSQWKFVPNNYRGTYTISKSGCADGERYFMFVIAEVDKETGYYDFMLKPTNSDYKSDINAGIRMHLAHLSDTDMTWEQTVKVEGKPFVISMKFVK